MINKLLWTVSQSQHIRNHVLQYKRSRSHWRRVVIEVVERGYIPSMLYCVQIIDGSEKRSIYLLNKYSPAVKNNTILLFSNYGSLSKSSTLGMF